MATKLIRLEGGPADGQIGAVAIDQSELVLVVGGIATVYRPTGREDLYRVPIWAVQGR